MVWLKNRICVEAFIKNKFKIINLTKIKTHELSSSCMATIKVRQNAVGNLIAFVGDSPIPAIALLSAEIADNYNFIFSKEHSSNAESFKKFASERYPNIELTVHIGPSITEPSESVNFAREFLLGLNEKQRESLAIFTTAGAKQTILPFLIHLPNSMIVSLTHSPPTLTINENNQQLTTVGVELILDDILASRGWRFTDCLENDNIRIENITPEYDTLTGKLSFTGLSHLKKEGREHKIHDLSRPEKKEIKEFDQITIGGLLQLAEEFGRNGAEYSINGALRTPNRSVLPNYINHSYDVISEEE